MTELRRRAGLGRRRLVPGIGGIGKARRVEDVPIVGWLLDAMRMALP
jgi:hypothetical protein